MDRNLQRALGTILSVGCLLVTLWAVALAARLILKGVFLSLFMPGVLLAVAFAVGALLAPLLAGIAGLVLNARSDSPALPSVLVPAAGIFVAVLLGRLANHYDPLQPPKPPAPPGCQASTANPSAINTRCPRIAGYERGACPEGYVCTQSVSHAYEGDYYVCEIPCTNDCECMTGARCVNASCQFGNNLP